MAQPFCPRCGSAQAPSNLFCPKCGHRLPEDEPGAKPDPQPEKAAPGLANGAKTAAAPPSDDLWIRLRAEEQEYSRRSRRNAGIGCLVVLFGLIAFGLLIWHWGTAGN